MLLIAWCVCVCVCVTRGRMILNGRSGLSFLNGILLFYSSRLSSSHYSRQSLTPHARELFIPLPLSAVLLRLAVYPRRAHSGIRLGFLPIQRGGSRPSQATQAQRFQRYHRSEANVEDKIFNE